MLGEREEQRLAGLRESVRGLILDWKRAGRFSPSCDSWMRSFDLGFTQELASRNWIGITWPSDLGGLGGSYVERLVLTEELLRAGAPVAAHWIGDRQIGPALLRYGSRALQEEFLPRIAAGEAIFCLGMSEPDAGSDLAAIRTSAVRDKRGWRINGSKVWTSHAHRSDYAYVLARTEKTASNKRDGLTEFIVDLRVPGVEVRPILDLANQHHFNELRLEDVWVDADYVIGEIGNGWSQVTSQLAFERGGPERILSTYPLFESLLSYTSDDRAMWKNTHIIGGLLARLRVLRQLSLHIALDMDRGEAPVTKAAMLKYLGTAFERDVVEAARQLLSSEPTTQEDDLLSLLAQGVLYSPAFSIRGGTSEILLGIIAREELKK